MILFLLVMILSVNNVLASQSVELSIQKGWNLIPWSKGWTSIAGDSDIKISDFTYGYLFDLDEQKYVLAWINNDYTEEAKLRLGDWIYHSSMWMYSSKDGRLKFVYGIDDVAENEYFSADLQPISLNQGWNFLWVRPEMVGDTFNDIKGNCEFSRIYSYGKDGGEWKWMNLLQTMSNEKFTRESIGYALVIKVPSECSMSSAVQGPPKIPE